MNADKPIYKYFRMRLPNGAEKLLALILLCCDCFILNCLFTGTFRLWLDKIPQIDIYLDSYYKVRLYLFCLYVFFGIICKSYDIRSFSVPSENFSGLLKTLLLTTFSFYMATFFSRELAACTHTFPRPVFIIASWGALVALFLIRAIASSIFKPHPKLLTAIIIGNEQEGHSIISHFHRKGGVRFRLVRIMKSSEVDELAAEVLLKHVHEIFVTDPTINLNKFWGDIYYQRKEQPHSFNLRMSIDTSKASGGGALRSLTDYPLITIPSVPLSPLQMFVKRAFDICFSIFALIITIPVMLLTAIGVKLDSPGPILYKQRRIGRYGKDFDVIKIRSMRTGAESKGGPTVSGADDKRVSSFGKFIRHFGIDELPQFFLVLTGDMSVVGPRPERPYFADKYIEFQGRRLSVKPGITGLAAVNSRYYLKLVDKVAYDYYYLDNYSFMLDLKIIFQTVWVLLFKPDGSAAECSENEAEDSKELDDEKTV